LQLILQRVETGAADPFVICPLLISLCHGISFMKNSRAFELCELGPATRTVIVIPIGPGHPVCLPAKLLAS
jgi:hypothetical protein